MVMEILKLGNPALYEKSAKVTENDLVLLSDWVGDLRDTLLDFRKTCGAGRAIAAPQIGLHKRLIYMLTDREYVFINPVITFPDKEAYEVMDECISFPGLCVRVKRRKRIVISYLDGDMQPRRMQLEGDYAGLLQHECDHLDGILATMRAMDEKSLYMM